MLLDISTSLKTSESGSISQAAGVSTVNVGVNIWMNVGSAEKVILVAAAAFPKHRQRSQLYFLTFPNPVPAMCDGLLFLSYLISFHISKDRRNLLEKVGKPE